MGGVNSLDPNALDLTHLDAAAISSGFGFASAIAAKLGIMKSESQERYYDSHPGARERDEAEAEKKEAENKGGVGLGYSSLNPMVHKLNPFEL